MYAKREHLVDYQATSIDSRLVERGSVSLKLRLTRPAATEARLLPGSLVLWLESGKVVLAAVRDRGGTGLLGICLLTDPGRPVPRQQITLYEYIVYYEAFLHSLAALPRPRLSSAPQFRPPHMGRTARPPPLRRGRATSRAAPPQSPSSRAGAS